MKAIQITTPGQLDTVEVDVPELHAGEVLLKINYAGFCGSDLNTFRGGNSMVTYPRIPGHEISATIEALGAEVSAGLTVGQLVTVNPYTSCGHCAACRSGRINACENNETLGVQRNGAMQQYIAIPWQKVIPADGLCPQDVALVEPLSVGFHAVDRGMVSATDVCMVIGCGMVGLGAVIAACQRGATVIAADLDDEKLAIAESLGASYTYNTATSQTYPEPSVIIEAVGSAPTYQLAINSVGYTGRVVCIGYAKSDVLLPTNLFVKKELNILGSRNATDKDFAGAIRYLQGYAPGGTQQSDSARALISGIVTPDTASEAMQQWDQAPGKVFRILVQFQ